MLRWILVSISLVAVISGLPQESRIYPAGRSAVVTSGISSHTECLQLCTKRRAAFRHCYGATYDSSLGGCRLHTNIDDICDMKTRRGDNSRQGKSIHFSLVNCASYRHPNSVYGEARNLGGGVCLGQAFRPFFGMNSPGGVALPNITTEGDCIQFCNASAQCWAVDFERSPPSCFFHSTSANLATRLSSSTTNQYQKICPGLLTNVNPFATQSSATTLSTAPTTAATVIPMPTIGVDGICPSPFELIANSTLGAPGSGTIQAATVNTTELCKQMCLNAATCLAADFDRNMNRCFFHTTYVVQNLMRGNQSCCDHFRKLNCAAMSMRQCWMQSTTINNLPADQYVGNADGMSAPFTMVACTGVCTFTRTSVITAVATPPAPPTQMFTITRGCDTTVPFQTPVNCSLERTTGTPNTVGFTRTTSYTCSDNLCNVFTQTDAENQLLYLPFDMTVEDHSAYMRNGYFWNSTMGGFTFDAFDKIKNKSALFDGMEMVCTPFNNININDFNPGITTMSWVKREATTPSVMGIISKGTTNTKANSSELFQLFSTFNAPNMHTYTFRINLNMEYSCSSPPVALNEWQLVIARFRTNGSIELYVINDNTRPVVIPATPTVSCPATGATLVDLSAQLNSNQDPLCVGGFYVNEDFTPIEGSTNFFVGHIDEVRVFRGFLEDTGLVEQPILSIANNID